MKPIPTILIVDDNPDALRAAIRLLERAGLHVTGAINGTEALRQIREIRPALVLLDLVLPDLGGLEVLRQVRADPALEDVSIVLLSSHLVSPEDQAAGLDGGADGYIARPIANAEFVARVRLHLRQQELTGQLRASEARLVAAQAVARMGSWETNLQDHSVTWSAETHRIFETDPAAFTPTHQAFLNFVHPDDRPAVADAFERALGESSVNTIGHRLLMPDGKIKFVEEHWQVFHDQASRPLRAIGTCRDITEQRQAEESQRLQAHLLNNVGQAVIATDINGAIIFSNHFAGKLYGWEPSEMLGRHIIDVIVPCTSRKAAAGIMERLNQGEEWSGEFIVKRRDGLEFPVSVTSSPLLDKDGNPVGSIGISSDITSRKQAETALEWSNRALKMLGRANEALIRSQTEAGLLEAICAVATEVGGFRMAWVGYALEDEFKTIQPKAGAGDHTNYLGGLRLSWSEPGSGDSGPAGRAIRSGTPVIIPDVERDDSFRPWLDAAQIHGFRGVISLPLKDQARTFGVLVLYLTEARTPLPDEIRVLQDLADDMAFGISNLRVREERREAQLEIARQAALLDMAQDAILVRDLANRIIYWNRSAERLYGWSAGEAIGRTLEEIHRNDAAAFIEATNATLAQGEWTGELRQSDKKGKPLIVEARWTLVRDEQGKATSILTINTDITERKNLEQQFLRGQRLESIGTLAGGIAHDLNNVLAPVMMSVELLRNYVTHSTGIEILDLVASSTRRGAEMIGHVLAFARGVEASTEPLRLADVVTDLAQIIAETFPKNISFETDIQADLWMIKGDATRIHQVFMNLCVNSRDAMPDGGTITLRAENTTIDERQAQALGKIKPGPFIRIEVNDTGHGIPAEVVDNIYDPFFTTKEPGKGTGLGLSTSLAIIEGHGGFMRVLGGESRGACFEIHLPAACQPAPTPTQLARNSPPHGQGETVLIIDDEEAIRSVTRMTLEASGYRVLLAADGAEALSTFARHRKEIAVVVTDMMMPLMDGAATIEALRQLEPALPIIAASGKPMDPASLKACHILPKPFTSETLLEALDVTLDRAPL